MSLAILLNSYLNFKLQRVSKLIFLSINCESKGNSPIHPSLLVVIVYGNFVYDFHAKQPTVDAKIK